MELTGKNVLVFVEQEFEDLELWYPVLRLREAGAQVVVAGTGTAEVYTGKYGVKARAEATVDELEATDFDAVVVPGGWAPDKLRRYGAVLDMVRQIHDQGKPLAAICHGPWVPCSAGVMSGHRATCSPGIKDDVIHAGANYVNQEVVVSRNLITSRAPGDLPAFCRETIRLMQQG